MRLLLALCFSLAGLAGFAPAAFAQSAAVVSLEQATRARPGDANLWFYLARAQALAGDKRAAVASLEKAGALGDGFLPPRDGFEALWDEDDFRAVRAKLEARLPRLDSAPIVAQLEDRSVIPEGIAYDIPSHTLYMGSIAQRKVLRISDTGVVSEFASGADLDAVLGIAVDSPRRIVYVVSTSALTDAGRARPRNAVLAFDADTRRFQQRYEVPAAAQLNDVAVAPGGRAFASDSANGAIYELPVKGPGPVRTLVPSGQLRGSNGLAASPDGKRLYVAHATGIAAVDIASGEVKAVANDTRETVAAIDGLYEWQGQLIGVQNATTPGRVVLVSLSHEGDRIVKVQTLLSHHHNQLDEPTTGAVTDHGFYLLAATGIAHFNGKGQIEKPESLPHPTILRIPLPR